MHMSKNVLETLFESRSKVKILKFLFRNSDRDFSVKEITAHVQETPRVVKSDLKKLMEIGLLRKNRNKF